SSKAFCLISSIRSSASENAVRYILFSISTELLLKTIELNFKDNKARIAIAPIANKDCIPVIIFCSLNNRNIINNKRSLFFQRVINSGMIAFIDTLQFFNVIITRKDRFLLNGKMNCLLKRISSSFFIFLRQRQNY